MKRAAGFVLALVSLLLFAAASASARTGCGRGGVICAQVRVPLDASGQVPGEVVLHVEELKAVGRQRGVMFLLAGGPGQAASQFFNFPVYAPVWRAFFPGYTGGTSKSARRDPALIPT